MGFALIRHLGTEAQKFLSHFSTSRANVSKIIEAAAAVYFVTIGLGAGLELIKNIQMAKCPYSSQNTASFALEFFFCMLLNFSLTAKLLEFEDLKFARTFAFVTYLFGIAGLFFVVANYERETCFTDSGNYLDLDRLQYDHSKQKYVIPKLKLAEKAAVCTVYTEQCYISLFSVQELTIHLWSGVAWVYFFVIAMASCYYICCAPEVLPIQVQVVTPSSAHERPSPVLPPQIGDGRLLTVPPLVLAGSERAPPSEAIDVAAAAAAAAVTAAPRERSSDAERATASQSRESVDAQVTCAAPQTPQTRPTSLSTASPSVTSSESPTAQSTLAASTFATPPTTLVRSSPAFLSASLPALTTRAAAAVAAATATAARSGWRSLPSLSTWPSSAYTFVSESSSTATSFSLQSPDPPSKGVDSPLTDVTDA